MPVDESTHTVSLSELESIFITLRFMEADKVYESKQVLVMIDMKIKHCLYYRTIHEPCLFREGQKKWKVRKDHEGGK